jgi:hypothetical protein
VNGSNFNSGADVIWSNPGNPGFGDGPTSFVSASRLTFQVSAADIAIPGAVQVKVLTPSSSLESDAVTFVINPGPAGGARVISPSANVPPPTAQAMTPC